MIMTSSMKCSMYGGGGGIWRRSGVGVPPPQHKINGQRNISGV